jgi:hypothetical protein
MVLGISEVLFVSHGSLKIRATHHANALVGTAAATIKAVAEPFVWRPTLDQEKTGL